MFFSDSVGRIGGTAIWRILIPKFLSETNVDDFANLVKGKMTLNQGVDVFVSCIGFLTCLFFKLSIYRKWVIV